MSIIKRIKMKGFKSFANPTVLTFENGFNTVVGANGSGKSNVFDALCFVLGRMSSKGLRAEKLGHLVFNGGKNLKASKDAEVSIFLSNDNKELMNIDTDEVKISRVVKDSGDSTYYLNSAKVTRTEIVEVLHRANIDPDGYNIILQGDITKVVNMTTVERRQLVEEIANISGYEEKRQKGLEKLEKLDLDLKNADMLMEEKTKYLKELKSEKEQAEKYHKCRKDLRENALLLARAKINKNVTQKQKKQQELEENEADLAQYKQKLEDFETQTKAINVQIDEIQRTIEIKSQQEFMKVTKEVTELTGIVQNLNEKKAENKKQITEIKTRIDAVKENIKKNKEQISQFETEIESLDKEKKNFEKELKEKEEALAKIKKGLSTESLKELDELDDQITILNQKKYDKGLIRQDNAVHVEKLNNKLESLQEEMNKMLKLGVDNKEQLKLLEKYKEEQKKIIITVSQTAGINSETAAKINSLEKEYNVLAEETNKLRVKANASKDLISSNKAVETILQFKSKDQAIFGSVAELGSVPAKYSQALETAAGRALFNVVVDSDTTAVKYINYLKQNRVGNVTFLPLNKINAKVKLDDSVLTKKGVIDYALNLIKFDARYTNIFHLVFSDTLIIEKIEDAKTIGIGTYKMVTLEGDQVAKSGAMSGGFNARKEALGAFKDENLSQKYEDYEHKLSSLRSTIDLLRTDKEDSEKKLYDLRQRKLEVEAELAKLEKILSIEGKDSSTIKRDIETILGDKTVIETSLKKIDKEISELDRQIKELTVKKDDAKDSTLSQGDLMQNIAKKEKERDEVREKYSAISSKIDSKNIQIKNVLKPESTNLEKILKESNESLEKYKVTLTEFETQITEKEKILVELKKKEKEMSKDYEEYLQKRDKLKEDKEKLSQKFQKEFERVEKLKEKSTELRYALSEFETITKTLNDELELLKKEIENELMMVLEDGTSQLNTQELEELNSTVETRLQSTSLDIKELQARVNGLKSHLSSFGSINMKAVAVYDKLKEEFDSLLEKRQTLTTEKDDILAFVAELDAKKKEKFMITFATLKDNFAKIYKQLSTKGEAEIEIEDEQKLFESGVEIKVRLSQRTFLDIKSLSGGEKTITAIAFIFAVQEFSPAHFYIFDEIDAALDILNAEKLGKLIRDHAHKAQYIVVSHNEYLIQSSQTIYGVSMDRNKISSVVSLDLRNMKDYVDKEPAPPSV